jgi:hypothetical protein
MVRKDDWVIRGLQYYVPLQEELGQEHHPAKFNETENVKNRIFRKKETKNLEISDFNQASP